MFRRYESSSMRVAVLLAFGLSIPCTAQFQTRSTVSLPMLMWSVATGDFNQDGNADVAVACDTQVQIFLGNGDGTFQTSVAYSYAKTPLSIATADFNGDGKLDFVVASGDAVIVQLGNGDGTFQSPAIYSLAGKPTFVGIGDFNGDHKADLIVAGAPAITVLLGKGDGTFQSPINTMTSGVAAVGWGDFNHDGTLDMVIASNDGFQSEEAIYLGNGNGTFQAGTRYSTTASILSIAVGDFNGDGNLDLAVGLESNSVDILVGNGDGTFHPGMSYPDSFATRIITVDLNGDSKLDLASSNLALASGGLLGSVSVMIGEGDGTFRPQKIFPTLLESWSLVSADFNNDHQIDLANIGSEGEVMTLLNTGTVSFFPTTALTFPPVFLGKVGPALKATLTNNGTNALAISSISVDSPFRLSTFSTCGASVAPGASCDIVATFKPSSAGLFTGAITIADDASSKPQVVELVGSGTVMTVSPGQLNFAPQKVGTKSAPQTVTITNRGKAAVDVNYILLLGGLNDYDFPYINHCGSQIDAGASCTVDVSFEPLAKHKQGGLLNVSIVGMGNASLVYLRGVGQ